MGKVMCVEFFMRSWHHCGITETGGAGGKQGKGGYTRKSRRGGKCYRSLLHVGRKVTWGERFMIRGYKRVIKGGQAIYIQVEGEGMIMSRGRRGE